MMADTNDHSMLESGIYRHYKGKEYTVIGIGKNTETEEPMVIYKPRYESDVDYWVRPYVMFTSIVQTDEGSVPRFVKMS